MASRYGRGSDYLNCPMNKEEYFSFVEALKAADTAVLREFEDIKVFEGCMPVEVMAKRGDMTLAFGPLKPVGLMDERRTENRLQSFSCAGMMLTDAYTIWSDFRRT